MATHRIDKSRLEAITRQHDAATGAAKKCYEDYKSLQSSLNAARVSLIHVHPPGMLLRGKAH